MSFFGEQEMELLVADCFAQLNEHSKLVPAPCCVVTAHSPFSAFDRALFILEKVELAKKRFGMTEANEKDVLIRLASVYQVMRKAESAANSFYKALHLDAESTVWRCE